MLKIRVIGADRKADINIPNEPFKVFGKFIPSFINGQWSYETRLFDKENVKEMTFPNENYNYDKMVDSIFIGAYDNEKCVGLAILQPAYFKYAYLYDLKVNREYRRKHVGENLIAEVRKTAKQLGYSGIYTQAQDDNLGACLFYLKAGFYIGGLDTNVYKHTPQAGKSDIIFYSD